MAPRRDQLEITTRDGVAGAWVHRTADGERPGVLMYPDALGVRPAMHAMAERLAGMGYVVLLPDVFYRAGGHETFDPATAWTHPADRERIMARIQSLTPDRVEVDGAAYLEALLRQPGLRAGRIGVTGYCMGGRMAFWAAIHHPDRVQAAASFHGGGLATEAPDSPHRQAGRIRASLYFGVADQDRSCPPEQQGALASALAAAGVEYRIELYKGKKHGFAVSDHTGAFDRDAADRHWRRLQTFFAETLGA